MATQNSISVGTFERVCSAAEAGQTYDDIARIFKIDRDLVKRIIARRYGDITPMQAARIRRMSAAGADANTIAQAIGCKIEVAEKFAAPQSKPDAYKYHTRQYLTTDKVLQVIDMYSNGRCQYSQIAGKTGLSESSISRVLRAAKALQTDPGATSVGDMTDYTLGIVALALQRRSEEHRADGEMAVQRPKEYAEIEIKHTISAEGKFVSVAGSANGKLTVTVGMVQFEIDATDLEPLGQELISIAKAIG